MSGPVKRLLRDLGRSVVGSLLLGLPLLYTMETWWLAWRLPAWLLLISSLVGLVAILVVTRQVGFRADQGGRKTRLGDLAQDFFNLTLSSFLAAYAVLLLVGVLEWGDPLQDIVRHGLAQVVPLGLGGAIANQMLGSADEEDARPFWHEMAVFALGAAFFALPVAPTEEMELMAAHAGWGRLAGLLVASLLVAYLALYELEFRGHAGRTAGARTLRARLGETVSGYVVALAVCAALLAGYGHLVAVSFPEAVQELVVLGFLASVGGAAARVVI